MSDRKCKRCGKSLAGKPRRVVFCSHECSSESRRKTATLPCAQCGREVERRPSELRGNVFCGADCSRTAQRRRRVTVPCKQCGDPVERMVSQVRRYVFCGRVCRAESLRSRYAFSGASLSIYELATIAGLTKTSMSDRITKSGIKPGEEVPVELLRSKWRPAK